MKLFILWLLLASPQSFRGIPHTPGWVGYAVLEEAACHEALQNIPLSDAGISTALCLPAGEMREPLAEIRR